MKHKTAAGASVYTPFTLKLYDWWVLGISNRYAWRCPTAKHLLPHFVQNTGEHHLDIGVGTGYYLTHLPETTAVTLLDLNDSSLRAAANRAGKNRVRNTLLHDVFRPFPDEWHNRFDSISMFYLLHCLPGTIRDKAGAIKNAATVLKKDGRLFGATIPGKGVVHNAFGRRLMRLYNRKGIFSNHDDCQEDLQQILAANFHTITVTTQGGVLLFSASGRRHG